MRIIDRLLGLLYPPRCAFCHRLMVREGMVCPECTKNLPFTNLVGREQKLPNIAKCVSPLYYEGDVRQSLLRYKFHSLTAYSKVYSEFMVKCIDECGISCDIITWVPLSAKRLRRRGYDQAQLLAEGIARRTGTECERLLKKTRDNPAQSGAGGAENRRANTAGVFAYAGGAPLDGKTVLLVDDIVTTGATLAECARVLKAAGAGKTFAVTAARRRD